MDSDIKLEGNRLVIEGDFCDVHATDLILDHPLRRKPPNSKIGQRRALVHDATDGLTINWGSDYPGGVTIHGALKVADLSALAIRGAPGASAVRITTPDLILDSPDRRIKELLVPPRMGEPAPKSAYSALRRALVHDQTDGLTINWGGDYPGGVTINGPVKVADLTLGAVRSGLEVKDKENRAIFSVYADYNAVVLRNKAGADTIWIHSDPSNGGSGIDLRNKDGRGTLTIDGEAGTLRIHGFEPGTGAALDLAAEIRSLRAQLAALKAEVAALKRP